MPGASNPSPCRPADPFDLPEWLATEPVVWSTDGGLGAGALVEGSLRAADHEHPCDLLAVDEAYPTAVTDETTRHDAHLAWRHGQVHLVLRDPGVGGARLTLLVPGTRFDPVLALEVVGRLAKALGADPAGFAVQLRLG